MLRRIGLGLCISVAAITMASAQTSWTPGGDTAAWPTRERLKKLPTIEEWAKMGPSAKAYVDKAKAIAGSDVDLQFAVSNVCAADGGSNKRKTYGVPNDPRLKPFPGPDPSVPMKPFKMYDNVWWFGTSDVGAYLLVTDEGYILFDALNNAGEARTIIVEGMKSVGLDPTKIKYFVIGHNHLDHTGGAHYIQSTFKPKTIMGRDDWRVYFDTMNKARAARQNPAAPATGQAARLDDLESMTHDTDAFDGMQITLGGTTVNLYMLPGHTPGSLAVVMPVRYNGESHNVLIMAAANDIDSRSSFTGGYEHVWQRGLDAKVSSVLHVHPNILMNTLANMKYRDEHPNEKPLYMWDSTKTAKYIEIQRACTQARMEILGW